MKQFEMKDRIAEAKKFFDVLYGAATGKRYGYLWTKQEGNTETYPFVVTDAKARAEMARKAIKLNDDGADVYIGVNLMDIKPKKNQRVVTADVTVQTATVSDIDVEGGSHISDDKKTYSPTFSTARALLPFEPSLTVDSGYGLHAYNVYAETIIIDDDNRENCIARNKRYIDVIRSRAGIFGGIDGVHDLPRILRCPGTFNYKCGRENAPMCHVVKYSDVRFTPTDMDKRLTALTPPPVAEQGRQPSRQPTFSTDTPTDEERARAMLQFIPLKDLEENEWLSASSALKNLGFSYSEFDALNQGGKHYNEKENRTRWNSLRDPSFDIETLHGIAKRYGYSEKDFQRNWHAERRAAFDSEQEKTAEDSAARTADKIKSCPINLRVPRDFEFSLRGITYIEPPRKEGKPPRRIDVSLTPCVVTRNFVDPVTFKTRCEVAAFIRNTWRTLEFSARTLADPRAAFELTEYGVKVLDAKLLCRFFAELVTENPDIAEIKAYNQTGWVDDDCTEFASPNAEDYVIRREGYDYRKIFAPKGNPDAWKEKFSEVMQQGGAPARVAMGIAAASFLVRPLGLINLQCHIHGKRSIGKTPLLKFCVSAFGDANLNGLAYSFGATSPKSRLELACAYRDMPLIAEELESLSAKESEKLPQDIYNFSLGIGGQVLKKDGTLRDAKIFSGARLTSGEHDITNATGNGGELKRVLSLRCATLLEENFAADLHGFCNRNRGHFLQAWIRYITKHRDEIAKDYHMNMTGAKNSQLFGYEHETDATQLSTLIAALTAYQHFKICIGLQSEANIDELNQDRPDIIARLPTAAEIDDTTRAIEYLRDFVAANDKFFAHEVHKPEYDNEFTQQAMTCYGKIFKNGEVAFIPSELTKILETKFKSADKLIAEFADRGKLRTVHGLNTFQTKIKGNNVRAIRFVAGILTDAESDSDDDETTA